MTPCERIAEKDKICMTACVLVEFACACAIGVVLHTKKDKKKAEKGN
jgi:hypothetical protein